MCIYTHIFINIYIYVCINIFAYICISIWLHRVVLKVICILLPVYIFLISPRLHWGSSFPSANIPSHCFTSSPCPVSRCHHDNQQHMNVLSYRRISLAVIYCRATFTYGEKESKNGIRKLLQ